MPQHYAIISEYFVISLIIRKDHSQERVVFDAFKNKFNLHEGENNFISHQCSILQGRNVLFHLYEYNETNNFEEFGLPLENYIFHESNFKEELALLTNFIQACFDSCDAILFALCAYEINGNLLAQKKRIEDFDCAFLAQFPIVYSRQQGSNKPLLTLNLVAQDIFTLYPVQFDDPVPK